MPSSSGSTITSAKLNGMPNTIAVAAVKIAARMSGVSTSAVSVTRPPQSTSTTPVIATSASSSACWSERTTERPLSTISAAEPLTSMSPTFAFTAVHEAGQLGVIRKVSAREDLHADQAVLAHLCVISASG